MRHTKNQPGADYPSERHRNSSDEAPHLPAYLFQPSFCSAFKEWDAFITFLLRVQEIVRIPITVKDRGVDTVC
ncbi:hypothetical protein DKU76_02550 [Salmonella enterica subsp. enterica serovar Napoli]|nr:hypothetical protein [Salmonella enterica subsp. enterica serovar Napoli]EBY5691692.1 hypothetical protein [Salmonella enterica subsp. enterica serovar Enteritidis]MLU44580.1 hypothetical protein [Salmonella enterica subsp. enterica serovar Napoli]